MPPNKLAYQQPGGQLIAWLNELPVVKQVRGLAGMVGSHKGRRVVQRFYPQCQRCSIKQATALRHSKRVLVMHMFIPKHRIEHLAGERAWGCGGLRFGVRVGWAGVLCCA